MIKLSVIPNIRSALYYTYANVGLVAKVATPWLAIYAVYTFIFQVIGMEEYLYLTDAVAYVSEFPRLAREEGYESLKILTAKLELITAELGPLVQIHDIFDKVIRLMAYSAVAVATVREYMLNAEPPRINFAAAEQKTAGYIIAYLATLGGVGVLLSLVLVAPNTGTMVVGIFYAIIAVVLLLIISRFLLVFPSVAIGDKKINPKSSWVATTGNGWGIFWGMLLVILSSLPVFIFKVTVGKIALPIAVIWPVQLLMSMVALTFVTTFLAICYQNLVLKIGNEKITPLY